ncbi:MAG: proline dehydrogenase family protein [Bacteroidia bacterium]|nr:proline dehydrogenase family protein [Bacteroidia bacterium]
MKNQGPSFEDVAVAFSNKTNKELYHSKWLFRLFGINFLVSFFSKMVPLLFSIGIPISYLIKKSVFKQFCAGETLEESSIIIKKMNDFKVQSILDYSVEGNGTDEGFESTKTEINRIILFAKENKAVPYTCLKFSGIAPLSLLEMYNSTIIDFNSNPKLDEVVKRFNSICHSSLVNNVPIFVDAEESWIQNSVDMFVENAMKKFNRDKAIVLTTLQMYRWDRIDYLRKIINESRKGGYFIGVKLVRGAYYEKENFRAKEMGYKSPIHIDKERVDHDFDKAVSICLENIDIMTLCIGSHNEESTYFALNEMKRLGLKPDDKRIYFSQLYGMSDNISFNLAIAGYNVTKYLPYGPVKSVIPYLIRRAEENSAISGQMSRELSFITTEITRRKTAQKLLN